MAVPRIRFKGFSEEWEEETLQEVVDINKGEQKGRLEISPVKTNDNPIPVYNGGIEPSGYTNVFNKTNKVLMSEGGNCGHINYYEGNFWSGGHNYTFDEKLVDKMFLKAVLQSKQELLYTLGVGTGIKNIQKSALSAFPLLHPSSAEQELIGQFFANLDRQITNQAKQLDIMKQLKKGYLQQMFV